MKKILPFLIAATLASFLSIGNIASAGWNDLKNDLNVYPAPVLSKPAQGVPYTDSVFGTKITRLTDAVKSSINSFVPDYSKREAWNSDGTLLMLRDADSNAYIYDGENYSFIKKLDGVGGEDVFWSPLSAREVWYNDGNTLKDVNVDTGDSTTLFTFANYDFANTKGEGNLSRDGHYYAVVGQSYNQTTGETTYKDLVILDVAAKKIVKTLALPNPLDGFDWTSISPLGNYVVVDYANDATTPFHGVEVYDRNFQLKWRKPIGAGHSDLGVDENGKEFLLMDYYNSDTNVTQIKKFDLETGNETVVLELSPVFDMHESCRNIQPAGWCLVSTFDYVQKLTATAGDWLPFENEVFLVKLDGSKTVKRLAHHHSRRYSPTTPDSDTSNYFAEPHATISPDGSKVIFASNWEENLAATNSVDAYLVNVAADVPGSQSPPAASGQIFTDVSSTDPNFTAIKYLKDNNIVGGYPDGSFKPMQTINRAEFTKILFGAFRTELPSGSNCFPDVTTEWFAPPVCSAKTDGIISGYPDGTFKPAQNVNFAEASKIIVVAYGGDFAGAGYPPDQWYAKYVHALDNLHAIPTTITAFSQQMTRGEMAEIIYRLKASVTNLPSTSYANLQ